MRKRSRDVLDEEAAVRRFARPGVEGSLEGAPALRGVDVEAAQLELLAQRVNAQDL
jgi:hypothetical protein